MQIIIDITSPKTATKRGTAKAIGKPYEITSQRGFLQSLDVITGEVMPVPIDIQLDRDTFAYEPGRYTLDASSIKVDSFGGLAIGRVKLVKVAQLQSKAA